MKKNTQVLVAGAGPVGLTAALCLQQQGIDYEIVDKASAASIHSNACLLSPETLVFLEGLGVTDDILKRAIRIKSVQLYRGTEQCAILGLSDLPSPYPFITSIPQSDLEEILISRLQEFHRKVLWNHRLTSVTREEGGFLVEVDQLGEQMTGYAVMHEEKLVEHTHKYHVKVVLGTDGTHSLVRRLHKIDYSPVGDGCGSILFEIKRDPREDSVLKIGITDVGTCAYVPLPHGRGRYGFVTRNLKQASYDRDTEHEIYEDELAQFPELSEANFHDLIHERMPYQEGKTKEVVWRASVPFGVLIADCFWKDGIFLMGDAARSGFPLSAKSINLGLPEAADIVLALSRYMTSGEESRMSAVAKRMRMEWEDLASLTYATPGAAADSDDSSVVRNRILQSLPLTGKDLEFVAEKLARQLDGEFAALT